MEKNQSKYFYIGVAILFVHFAVILLYLFPVLGFQNIAKKYVEPVFIQNWRMFAPDVPMEEFKLEYRTFTGEWSIWEDGKTVLPSSNYKMGRMYSHAVHSLSNSDIDLGKEILYEPTFLVAMQFMERCIVEKDLKVDQVQIRLLRYNLTTEETNVFECPKWIMP